MSTADEREFQGRMRRVEGLVQTLEACPDPAAREGARALVRALLDLHAAGLAKMLELASHPDEAGASAVDRFADDGLVGSLLLLHGLHPVPVARRVARALERVRTWGGRVEVLEATEQAVRVRLRGDPSAGPALRRAVEQAVLEAAPDVHSISFEEEWDSPSAGRVALPLVNGGRVG